MALSLTLSGRILVVKPGAAVTTTAQRLKEKGYFLFISCYKCQGGLVLTWPPVDTYCLQKENIYPVFEADGGGGDVVRGCA